MTRAWRVLGPILLVAGAGRAARAEDSEALAAASFQRGSTAYSRGDYREAASHFELAYRYAPRAATAYNLAVAWELAQEPSRAADAYALAVASSALPESQRKDGAEHLAALERTLGRVDVTGTAGTLVSVAHVERQPTPLRVHLPPGDHELRAVPPNGREAVRRITVSAGSTLVVSFEPPRPVPSSAPIARAPIARDRSGGSLRTLGFVAIAGAGLASAAAIYLGVRTLDARDEFDAGERASQEAHDEAVALRTWTTVAWLGAGALAATGAVLVVTSVVAGDKRSAASARRPALLPAQAIRIVF
jgi:tetratricopeptide (TPR) repeat protein